MREQLFIGPDFDQMKPINISSLKQICGHAEQAMIYGWEHCHYAALENSLSKILKRVFDFQVGSKNRKTLEGSVIQRIDYAKGLHPVRRECKSGLVNMVFENYKRSICDQPLIPILFVIDTDLNPYPTDSSLLASRQCHKMTVSELRRVHKLCHFEGLSAIKEIAKKSFKFIKLTLDEEGLCTLKEIAPFWESEDWGEAWRLRKSSPKSTEKLALQIYDQKSVRWQAELVSLYNKFHQNDNNSSD